jgi:ribosomal protein S4
MAWNVQNLTNMVKQTKLENIANLSVFQQRWRAKRELRAYHVPNITERQFIDRHFSARLPVRMASDAEKNKMPPIQALAFAKLERRVDVVVFRSHFSNSIWGARKAVVDGKVQVNGEKVRKFDAVQISSQRA